MRKTLKLIALSAMLLASPTFADGAAMPSAPIVFFDIAGPDAAKLRDFYASNFGWDIAPSNMIKTPNLEGTLRQDPPEKILYIGVTDLDAAMAKVKATGGTIETPKLPTPTGEQFVLFRDPAGNRMGLVGVKK
ncbi:MAG TPA: VOC family protein [Thermoanaerobaculia bacterium]|nr:VOC family protein [Thermoanaerobaculia bacterium]